jgi:hypothetical protein
MNLQEIESVKITILVDNITDRLLPSISVVKRPSMISNQRIAESPSRTRILSDTGICYTHDKSIKTNNCLSDTGVSKDGIVHNSDVFVQAGKQHMRS